MLFCGGMTNVATVLFGSFGSSFVERRSFHMSLILILWVLSSYWRRPWSERNFESSVSLLGGSPSWSERSSMLRHDPSLMVVKNSSMLKARLPIIVLWVKPYFSMKERLVELALTVISMFFDLVFIEEFLGRFSLLSYTFRSYMFIKFKLIIPCVAL